MNNNIDSIILYLLGCVMTYFWVKNRASGDKNWQIVGSIILWSIITVVGMIILTFDWLMETRQ